MSAEPFFAALKTRFGTDADRLNALDAAIGDGDHGATMLRGLTKAKASDGGMRAKAFMRASGGASGTLFGLILLEIEEHLETGAPLRAASVRAGLSARRRSRRIHQITGALLVICLKVLCCHSCYSTRSRASISCVTSFSLV